MWWAMSRGQGEGTAAFWGEGIGQEQGYCRGRAKAAAWARAETGSRQRPGLGQWFGQRHALGQKHLF